MGFWRKKVIDPALDHETERQIAEQKAWITREPSDARPWYHLALLYRMQGRPEEALGLLLECVRLDGSHAAAHVALAEMYAVAGDGRSAWRHARKASDAGDRRGVELLVRYGVGEE